MNLHYVVDGGKVYSGSTISKTMLLKMSLGSPLENNMRRADFPLGKMSLGMPSMSIGDLVLGIIQCSLGRKDSTEVELPELSHLGTRRGF